MPIRFNLAIAMTLACTGVWAASQDNPPTIRVVFQNTTSAAVDIFLLDDSDEPAEVLFAPGLPSGKQFLQTGTPDVTWRIKHGDATIAEYVSSSERIQVVDIQEAVDWLSPVEVVIQNTTKGPIDIFWLDEEGQQIEIGQGLPAQREFSTQTMPGHDWVIKQSDKVIAEFAADSHKQQFIDVAKMATWLQPVQLYFQNLTKEEIDIYWVNGEGAEIRYTATDDAKPLPLPPQQRMTQRAQPLSVWRIRRQDELLAEYTADNEPRQIIDIEE